jgi:hypothetical protein
MVQRLVLGSLTCAALVGPWLVYPVEHPRAASRPVFELPALTPSAVREAIAELPQESQAAIATFAGNKPYAFQRALSTARERRWGKPGPVYVMGTRKPQDELRAQPRRKGPYVMPVLLVEPARLEGRAGSQSYGYGDAAGQVWVWEWDCGGQHVLCRHEHLWEYVR